MKVVHVGMGKTATSSLQTYVFPMLKEYRQVGFYNPPELAMVLDAVVNGYAPEADAVELVDTHEKFLLSNETLMEWDPALWEPAADRLLRVFGSDVVILITLRDPKSYLRSLYQQILHAGKIRSPEDFFLPHEVYRAAFRFLRAGEMDAIDIDAFDIVRVVELYVSRFTSVVLVPFEAISDLRFLSGIWNISEQDRESIRKIFAASPHVNPSYSRLAVALTLGRERLLARLGLRTRSASDIQLCKALAHARGEAFARPVSLLPSWPKLMRVVSRHGPENRYCLPDGLYLGQWLDQNEAFYSALQEVPRGYLHFRDGQAEGFDLDAFRATPQFAVRSGHGGPSAATIGHVR